MSAINWLSAWLLFILIMIVIMQTRIGNTLIYYLAWLAVIFLLVSHYQEISNILTAGGITPNAQQSQSQSQS